ncbi:hypothetical protein [Acinetobacter junii]|nr:hypothetical protein [Acinetobacter junii]ENV52050.1 hypothetical protein F953_00540 [Acinetobacter junii CIP 107470 = MTCC 11364]
MEPILFLVYTSSLALILVSLFVSGVIIALINLTLKKPQSNFSIFPLAILIYFTIQFSPLPPQLNQQVIRVLIDLDENKVDSNAAINTVIFSCQKSGKLRGYEFERFLDAFHRDMDNHFRNHSSFSPGMKTNNSFLNSNDVCKSANFYNDKKFERLMGSKQNLDPHTPNE